MKSCGTCEHWRYIATFHRARMGDCTFDYDIIPCVADTMSTQEIDGSECPLWKAKNDN